MSNLRGMKSLWKEMQKLPGGSATLACLLTKYSPQGAQVSWEVDGTEVTEGVLTTSEEEKSGSYSS
ncbi:hypothetical protein D4764_0132470, partial [Takifugu flavidus]